MPSAAPTKAIHRLRRTPFHRFHGLCHSSASPSHAILPLRVNTHRTHTPPRPSFKGHMPRKTSIGKKRRKRTKHNTGKGTDITVSHVRSQSGKLMGKEAGEKLPQKPTAERKTEGQPPAHTLSTRHARTLHTSHAFSRTPPPYVPQTKKTGSEPCKVPTL